MANIDMSLLQMVELFADLEQRHLEVLAKNMRPLAIEAGELLVEEGVTTRGPLMLVVEGRLQVSRKDAGGTSHAIAELEPSTVIGEMEFLTDLESNATVRALDDVRGFLLPRQRFEALLQAEEPAAYHLALAIGRFVSTRLAETNVLLTRALAGQPEQMRSAQSAQLQPKSMEAVDAALDELLE